MENKVIARNKTAFHRYDIIEKIEAGIALKGTEVKSLRKHNVDLKDSYARVSNGEVFIHNMYITPYEEASYNNEEPRRIRKLLLHKREIDKLLGKVHQKSLTIIPLSLYFNNKGKAKIELAVAKGRKIYDQREKIKKKEVEIQLRKVQSFRK
ncbi:MAG: SsrA-binding protein SmpB [PVC group bacterium]|nr:SsrA-binding protein SmpB [PVC group bacterium]